MIRSIAPLIALLLSAAADAGPPLSTAVKPAPARPSAAAVRVPVDRFTLPNGLTVLVYTDHTVPTIHVGMRYRIGSKDEPPGRTGFAHLFEHLMFQQTAHRDQDYFVPLQRAGAVGMNGMTTNDYTAYYQTVPTGALDLALWMESDRMGYLDGGITQALLDAQRGVVLNEKRQAEAAPGAAATARLLHAFYPVGHPYAHPTIGSTQDIERATLADVKRWFTDYYGASNAVLVLAGDIDLATAKEKVTRYFGAMRAGRPVDQTLQWTPAVGAIRRDLIHDDVPAVTLTRHWPVANDDPRAVTLLLLAARSMVGRADAPLVRELAGEGRAEREKVATRVGATVLEGKLTSRFDLSVTLRPGISVETGRAAIDAALQHFLAAGPDPERLAAIVSASDTMILRRLESGQAIGDWLADGEVLHGDPTFFLKQRDWIAAATPQEVRSVAATFLSQPYYEAATVPLPPTTPATSDIDRSHMPVPAPTNGHIAFPAVTPMRLANGLGVVVAPRPKAMMVDMRLRFPVGTADPRYPPGVPAAAFDLLPAGDRTHDRAALQRAMARMGMQMTAGTDERHATVAWSVRRDRLDPATALVAQVVRAPRYPIDAVAEAVQAAARPQERTAAALLREAILPPATAAPSPDPVSRAAIQAFHTQQVRPDRATLYIVGNVTPEEARALAERQFGDWPAAGQAPADAPPPPSPPSVARASRIVLVDAPGAAQSVIAVGAPVAAFDEDRAAAERLAVAAIADGSLGRLNMNLRQQKGWSYGIGGEISDEPRGPRLFAVTGAVETGRTADSIAEIARELRDYLTVRPLTERELAARREAAIRSIPLGFGGNASFLDALIAAGDHGLPYDRAAGAADRLARVTLAQARTAASGLYDPDRLTFVVIGDLGTIEPAVRALRLAPVEIRDARGRLLR